MLHKKRSQQIIILMSNTKQTQEAARQRLLDRLSGKHQADVRAKFMAAAQGLSAHQAARAVNSVDAGHDYRRCSKGDMAAALCHREDYVIETALAALRGAVRT